MKLSVVIVSYNVRSFLSRCLTSLAEACASINYEIIIVDNASNDGSISFLERVVDDRLQVIKNKENLGFGRAMNLGFEKASGEYVLILNPDTIVSKESIVKSIHYISSNAKCGAVGVRMIDGQGLFLEESKRNFPTIQNAIQKLIGSKSGAYYAHHIEEHEDAPVDVLTGAFMMTTGTVLDEVGGFDRAYFMYGEDIDLCRTMKNKDYYSYYLGSTSIIHFKGESTDKKSSTYSQRFYGAMMIYFKKHHSQNRLILGLLGMILFGMGTYQWSKANVEKFMPWLLRCLFNMAVFYGISKLWAASYFKQAYYFDHEQHLYLIGVYSVVLASFTSIAARRRKLKSVFIGAISLLIGYALLPLEWRTSRFVLIAGAAFVFISEAMFSLVTHIRHHGHWRFWEYRDAALLIGYRDTMTAYLEVLNQSEDFDIKGVIDLSADDAEGSNQNDEMDEILRDQSLDVLIIDQEAVKMHETTRLMAKYGDRFRYFLFSNQDAELVSSPDRNRKGTVSMIEARWAIGDSSNRIYKRCFDLAIALLLLALSPIIVWMMRDKVNFFKNLLRILFGNYTYVGYNLEDFGVDQLPVLRPSILQLRASAQTSPDRNRHYARDYSIFKDLKEILCRFTELGNKANA